MRILIEATQAFRRYRGWGRYNLELIRALPSVNPEIDYTFFYNKDKERDPNFEPSLLAKNVEIFPIVGKQEDYDGVEGDEKTKDAVSVSILDKSFPNVDLYHSVTEYPLFVERMQLVTTIHELTPYLFPQNYDPGFYDGFLESTKYAAKHSRALIAPSEQTKRDIQRFLDIDPKLVFIIPHGVSEIFTKCIPVRRASKNHTLLYVGGLNKLAKNFSAIAEVMPLLPKVYKLLIVNKEHSIDSLVEKFPNLAHCSDRVEILDNVNDAQLLELYRNSSLFVFPSRYEGFGLPVFEAMACGCPILCGANPATLEYAAGLCEFFDPTNIEDLQSKIISCHRTYHDSTLVCAREYVQKNLTWQQTASAHVEVYRFALRK